MPKLTVPQTLTTKRLVIRRFIPQDFESFWAFVRDDIATRYLHFTPKQKARAYNQALLDRAIKSYDGPNQIFGMAVTEQTTGCYAGSLGLVPLDDGTGVELFYAVQPEYWGRGYAVEAARRLIQYVFEELKLGRVLAFCELENAASIAVANKLGMRDHGELQRDGHTGRWFALTRSRHAT